MELESKGHGFKSWRKQVIFDIRVFVQHYSRLCLFQMVNSFFYFWRRSMLHKKTTFLVGKALHLIGASVKQTRCSGLLNLWLLETSPKRWQKTKQVSQQKLSSSSEALAPKDVVHLWNIFLESLWRFTQLSSSSDAQKTNRELRKRLSPLLLNQIIIGLHENSNQSWLLRALIHFN